MSVRRPHFPGLWWLSPPGVVLLIVPVTLAFAVGYSRADYRSYFSTPKSLTTDTAVLFALGATCFVIGALAMQVGRRPAPRRGRWPWLDGRQLDALRRSSTPLFVVTLLGYLAFVVAGARNGVRLEDVWSLLLTQNVYSGNFKQAVGTVPGLTTLTQVGIAYFVVGSLLLVHGPDRKTLVRMGVLGALTLLRAFLFTERLAIVEVAIPVVAVLAARAVHSPDPTRRLMLRLAPVPMVALLVVGFAASEYSRSYQYYKTRTDDSLLDFSLKRLSGYYATAYNNGQLMMDYDRYPGRLPYTTAEALWTAPGVEDLDVYDRLVDREYRKQYNAILATYGNPEFNNPGGLPAPFVDYGRGGGLLFLLALGVVVGFAYRCFTVGAVPALLLYPMSVTGLFELPRFLYWSLGRTLAPVVALLAVAWFVGRARRHRPTVAVLDRGQQAIPSDR